MNNTGKTSFLKALQIVFGNRQFISQDDFYISGNSVENKIIIDAKIVPINDEGEVEEEFSELWEILFTDDRIRQDKDDNSIVPIRTIVTFDTIKNSYKSEQYTLPDWGKFHDEDSNTNWFNSENGQEKRFVFDELPFFYMDAQRDIIEDIKIKSSYFGRMISKIEYEQEDIVRIEEQIKELNENAVNSSDILTTITDTLKQLDTAMNTSSEGVEITPFTKKIRDLSKGLSIYYSDRDDSFSMEYHGMGTRSWSSLLTLKSFIILLFENSVSFKLTEHSFIKFIAENINEEVVTKLQIIKDNEFATKKNFIDEVRKVIGSEKINSYKWQITKFAEKIPKNPFFPILAIEEPEAHLHPNGQKKLYSQISEITGQKIISTHSPYIAASAELNQIRNFYKLPNNVSCGLINTDLLSSDGEDERKIKRQVINTRGELFFSKAIVFFEGETEEQALPIFAEKYFGKTATEMAIDFVGVGGFGNYLPFIRVAEGLKIPWFILSDGETKPIKGVKKILKKLYNKTEIDLETEPNIFILPNECDFERYFIENDFLDEIKLAFSKLHDENYLANQILRKDGTKKERIKTSDICDECNQNIYEDILRNYNGDAGFKDAVYDCMIAQKTQFGPAIAQEILESGKDLPPIIKTLFDKVNEII